MQANIQREIGSGPTTHGLVSEVNGPDRPELIGSFKKRIDSRQQIFNARIEKGEGRILVQLFPALIRLKRASCIMISDVEGVPPTGQCLPWR